MPEIVAQGRDQTPLVSVAMTAYSSAGWIARAIESALRQETDFAVEIVVGDDCSSDGTAASTAR